MYILYTHRPYLFRPYPFRPQSEDIQDCGGYQTVGVDMVVTGERIILLDIQVNNAYYVYYLSMYYVCVLCLCVYVCVCVYMCMCVHTCVITYNNM